jgi:hypothetical protein
MLRSVTPCNCGIITIALRRLLHAGGGLPVLRCVDAALHPAATPAANSALPNRLLRREGEIGCAVVAPVDALDRPATGSQGSVMATTTSRYGSWCNEKLAASDLRRYRKKGPRPWSRTRPRQPRHVPARRLRRACRVGPSRRHRYARQVISVYPGLDRPAGLGGARSAPLRPGLPARHAHREARLLRDERHPALAPKAGPRLRQSCRHDRAGCSRERSQPPLLSKSRTRVAG